MIDFICKEYYRNERLKNGLAGSLLEKPLRTEFTEEWTGIIFSIAYRYLQ